MNLRIHIPHDLELARISFARRYNRVTLEVFLDLLLSSYVTVRSGYVAASPASFPMQSLETPDYASSNR